MSDVVDVVPSCLFSPSFVLFALARDTERGGKRIRAISPTNTGFLWSICWINRKKVVCTLFVSNRRSGGTRRSKANCFQYQQLGEGERILPNIRSIRQHLLGGNPRTFFNRKWSLLAFVGEFTVGQHWCMSIVSVISVLCSNRSRPSRSDKKRERVDLGTFIHIAELFVRESRSDGKRQWRNKKINTGRDERRD